MSNEIKMWKGEKYLQKRHQPLPSGRIFKQYTGIGATTLEIEDQSRNSIIVCPTRALAASKAISKKVFYIGGNYPGVVRSEVQDVLDSLEDDSRKTKVMVVANSLIGLVKKLGDEVHKFFFMFDEIDSFQSEANYRPVLEDCLELYFDTIKPENRNMVSATLQESVYDKIEEEPLSIVEKTEDPQDLKCIHCESDVIAVAKSVITSEYENKSPKEKVLIALNSIQEIGSIIDILPDLKDKIGILCSEDNKDPIATKFRTHLEDGKLEKEVVFMTCGYFAGVDIDEKTRAVAIVNTNVDFTILTKAKIFQIFGRSRKGCKTRTFIFNLKSDWGRPINTIRNVIDHRIKLVEGAISNTIATMQENPLYDEDVYEQLINKTIEAHDFRGVLLIRYNNATQKAKINRLNIDYLLHQQNAVNSLYSDVETTKKTLDSIFNATMLNSNEILSESDKINIVSGAEGRKKKIINRAKQLASSPFSLVKYKGLTEFEGLARDIGIMINEKKEKSDITNELDSVIASYDIRRLKRYHQILKIHFLSKDHPLKKIVNKSFSIGESYYHDDIVPKLKAIEKELKKHKEFDVTVKYSNKTEATQSLNMFFITTRSTLKYKQARKIKAIRGVKAI